MTITETPSILGSPNEAEEPYSVPALVRPASPSKYCNALPIVAERLPRSKSHWPVTVLEGTATATPLAEGPPKTTISASLNLPDRIWMELTYISRRSSWSPSPNRIAVGCNARRTASKPWFAVQSSCLIPSTYLVTTGGVAASSYAATTRCQAPAVNAPVPL